MLIFLFGFARLMDLATQCIPFSTFVWYINFIDVHFITFSSWFASSFTHGAIFNFERVVFNRLETSGSFPLNAPLWPIVGFDYKVELLDLLNPFGLRVECFKFRLKYSRSNKFFKWMNQPNPNPYHVHQWFFIPTY
jgi:hypothetical protein